MTNNPNRKLMVTVTFILTTQIGCVSTPPPATPTPTQTLVPNTSTPTITPTPTLDPQTAIYTLAYELRDQYGNFEIVKTDWGADRVVFETGNVFQLQGGRLVEIDPSRFYSSEPEIIPIYTQEVNTYVNGVQMNIKVVTDDSFRDHSDPSIVRISIDNNTVAQFIARAIFKTWWVKGNTLHEEDPTENDFIEFMKLWASAQNGSGNWDDVQFETFVNEINSPGYLQELVKIWPMYNGDTNNIPNGVQAVSEINIVYVIGEFSTNRTILDNIFGIGLGVNIDETKLSFYIIPISTLNGLNANPAPRSNRNLVGITQAISWFLINNTGRPNWNHNIGNDKQLYNLLINGFHSFRGN